MACAKLPEVLPDRDVHRACSASQTVEKLQPLLSRFGITRVANLSGLDRFGLPVVMVCRPNARSSAVFHGKGLDLASAKAAGLMEAIETWHAEHPDVVLRYGCRSDFSGRLALIDTDLLPRVAGGREYVDQPLHWVEGQDLFSGAAIWLPFDLVHADNRVNGLPSSGCFAASTNGLASGNTFQEAVSHALCEVIERDATSLWRQSSAMGRNGRRLDLSSVTAADCRSLMARMLDSGLDVAVWDTTTDIGIPAFQCLIAERGNTTSHLGAGAGCHPARNVALQRALVEALQVRMTYIIGSREDIEPNDYASDTLTARHAAAHAMMCPVEQPRDFAAVAQGACAENDRTVGWILERLASAGIRQAVAVDLTRPDIGIAVVRVVIPGLEGSDHHSGYVPGQRARFQGAAHDGLHFPWPDHTAGRCRADTSGRGLSAAGAAGRHFPCSEPISPAIHWHH